MSNCRWTSTGRHELGSVTEIVAADIGGTHARFAIAELMDGRVVRLGEPVTLRTSEQDGLVPAWRAVGAMLDRPLPRAVALAAASPSGAAGGRLTNDIFGMTPAALDAALSLDAHLVLNDFGAVAHAVQQVDPAHLQHICGPAGPLPDAGVVTVCGPGTGIGCAQLVRGAGACQVIETEGGHIGFAPSDAFEDALVVRLRERYGRASAERVCSGPGLLQIVATLAAAEGSTIHEASERGVWQMALDGTDEHAVAALERFCRALGSIAGDLALAQGSTAVVIAGGLGLRLRDVLPRSGFAERFRAKGRFEAWMAGLPVKLITHPQPGLFGAAAAFAAKFG